MARLPNADFSTCIAVRDLAKVYSKMTGGHCGQAASTESHWAVRGVSYRVDKGEMFGLLGPNGAGKTSTLQTLTGELHSTRGDAYVAGHSIKRDLKPAFQNMGYCPQFSALMRRLSVMEHLMLFGQLEGFSLEVCRERARAFMLLMNIEEHADVWAQNLSGGTQRKLSVLLALMGDPAILLMDEPSCGLDPGARRVLWNVIRQTVPGRAGIMTTHSMEEADALCDRIGIMVMGRLRCVGTPQHLKSRYGDGYALELKAPAIAMPALDAMVRCEFPGASLEEEMGGRCM